VKVGDELPALAITVTATTVVAGAMASRDFQDVHHDASVSKASGAKDIFLNILTTQGFAGRFVTDWAGPGARITKMAIRLGMPCYPGDILTFTGRVVSIEPATVELRGAVPTGDHVTGTITFEL
jgi:acyl dehydratase